MTEHRTQHTAQCRHDDGQRLTAYHNGTSVIVEAFADDEMATEPFLTPADARTFARGILALADEVDGGEKAADPKPAIKVGDRVRIITAGSRGARVRAGEIYTVRDVADYDIRVAGAGANGLWYLNPDDVERVDDEPVIDASKIVALDDSAPTRSRAALLEQAADLMINSQTYTAFDLTELADYLAGEK
jgi:hypothetical protein